MNDTMARIFSIKAPLGALLVVPLSIFACYEKTGGHATVSTEASSSAEQTSQANDETAQAPVNVTGTYLISYDSARVRCDYQTLAPLQYNTMCTVVARLPNGTEVKTTNVAQGLQLSWAKPDVADNSASLSDCVLSADLLHYNCKAAMTSQQKAATITFSLNIVDPTQGKKPARTESANLLLPFAVGIAAGFVPAVPFKYDGRMNGGGTPSGTPASPTPLGFQQYSFNGVSTTLERPTSGCMSKDRLFFAHGDQFIYVVENGVISLYAGSSNAFNIYDLSDRLRASIIPWSIHCTDDAIYVASSYYCMLFKIKDEGPVEIVAGKRGQCAASPDGQTAAIVPIASPGGVAVSSTNEVYFTEKTTAKIRKITKDGLLSTVVQTGIPMPPPPDPASGAQQTAAPLPDNTSWPLTITLDQHDTVYFSDTYSATVKKIGSDGKLITVAGTGTPRTADTDPAQKALLQPIAIALGKDGSLYVSEFYRGLKKFRPDGTMAQVVSGGSDILQDVETMIGFPTAQSKQLLAPRPSFKTLIVNDDGSFYLDGPSGINAYTKDGSLAKVVVGNQNAADSCKSSLPAQQRRFYEASGLTYTKDNKLLVQDWKDLVSDQIVIWEVGQANGDLYSRGIYGCDNEPLFHSFNQTGSIFAPINSLGSMVTADDGTIFMSDALASRIVKIDPSGSVTNFAGSGNMVTSGENVPAAQAGLGIPIGLALGPDKSLYFVEWGGRKFGSRVRKISPAGMLSTVAGVRMVTDLSIPYTLDVFYEQDVTKETSWDSGDGGPATAARIMANNIAVSADGRIFLTDIDNNKIKMIDTKGVITTIAGGGTTSSLTDGMAATSAKLLGPSSIAVTNNNTLYFVNYGTAQVLELKQDISGVWRLAVLFGTPTKGDCGSIRQVGQTEAGAADDAIKNSLAIICQGQPRSVTVKDTCQADQGETRIAISQDFFKFMNIIEIIKPCN